MCNQLCPIESLSLIRINTVNSPRPLLSEVPYSAKRWRWKTLANSTENYIGEKTLPNYEKQRTLVICIADVELPSTL